MCRNTRSHTLHATLKRTVNLIDAEPALLQNSALEQVDHKWTPLHLAKFEMSFQHFVQCALYKSRYTNDYIFLIWRLIKSEKYMSYCVEGRIHPSFLITLRYTVYIWFLLGYVCIQFLVFKALFPVMFYTFSCNYIGPLGGYKQITQQHLLGLSIMPQG